ncbi:MAG TPA: hypothetical protein EYP19_02175 [Desulfobacterales bacterium]|nr:hypothetical protein [Desulfobacterales bacterium]
MKRTGRLLFLFLLFHVLMGSCATIQRTQPNVTALYRIPAIEAQLPPLEAKSPLLAREPLPPPVQALFQELYALDSSLALEIGKLPEFQGQPGQRQISALARFTDLIADATPEEKSNLANLLEVGQPEFRRYCVPLQAIFWLLEQDETYLKHNPLRYPLQDILNYAWDFTEESRWRDFEVVTDRLNSPELINYYERANFTYVSHGECPGSAKGIFKSKKGCCSDYTAFSVYCLRKAGYDAKAIKVVSPTGRAYHVVCEYEDRDGKKYIMDNSCRICGNGEGITEKKEYTRELPQIGLGYI